MTRAKTRLLGLVFWARPRRWTLVCAAAGFASGVWAGLTAAVFAAALGVLLGAMLDDMARRRTKGSQAPVRSPVDLDESYRVLGLHNDADDADILRAYKRQRRESHPDAAGGSSERFLAVTRAFEDIQRARAEGSQPSIRSMRAPNNANRSDIRS